MIRLGAVIVLGIVASGSAVAVAPARAQQLFRLADPRIAEASGLAAGVASPGIFYVENDSGDTNRFFAIDARTGATAATVTVPGARNVDWEDIAAAPGTQGTPSVWLADIGDNDARRRQVQVYRLAEPHVRPDDRNARRRAPVAEVWHLRYPGGPVDAEALAVAPDGTAYIVTKTPGAALVYRVPARPDPGRIQVLRRVGAITLAPTGTPNPFGIVGQLTVTGASIARDGSLFVVRTYADAYVWRLGRGGVSAALRSSPARVALPRQRQGEGIAVSGRRIVVNSEGVHTAVYSVPIPGTPPSSPVPTRTPAATAEPAPGRHRALWVLAAGLGAAAAAALVVLRMRKTRRRDD